MLGEIIDGRYRILRVLGEGGMGAVYEAEHTGTGRGVALKVIHALIAKKSEMVLRFQREAKAAGALETPHIVQVLDTGTDPVTGVIYMAMELLRGEDVQHLLKRLGNLPPELALRLVGQACIGLGKAHAAGVIHRDIKPANLFLSTLDSGAVVLKVVDFGIAKMMETTTPEEELTRTGGMLGSPLYMSPEQAMGSKSIDQRTDIWSLGVTLYKVLTSQAPHAGVEIGMPLLLAICKEPAPPIQDVAPWVPPEVAQIVHRMLAIVPDNRFQSMAAVLEAIQPLVPGGLSVRASDLVGLGEAEQAHRAARAVLAEELVTRRESAWVNSSSSASALASAEAGLSISQGAALGSSPARKTQRRQMIALALVLGAFGLVAYKIGSHSATPASGSEPVVAAVVASVASAAPPVVVAPTPPPDERTVRLAVEPADARVEVDGRATPVKEGGIELHGVNGSVHHVRLFKGAQETIAEVAITRLGAVPPRMQVETIAPRLLGKPLGARVDAGRAAPPAISPVSRPTGPEPAVKFE